MSYAQASEGIIKLCQKYPDDLADDFTKEFQQFITFTTLATIEKISNENKATWMYRVIIESKMIECFPNVETALRLYLCLMITICRGERSFSLF